MHLSALQPERYFIKQLNFIVNERYQSKSGPDKSPEIDVQVGSLPDPENPRRWQFEVKITTKEMENPTEFPYSFNVVTLGIFVVSPNYPAEKVEQLARVNGPTILYSGAREVIIGVTSRSGFPALMLPSITFIPAPVATKPETTETEPVFIRRRVLRGKVSRKKKKS